MERAGYHKRGSKCPSSMEPRIGSLPAATAEKCDCAGCSSTHMCPPAEACLLTTARGDDCVRLPRDGQDASFPTPPRCCAMLCYSSRLGSQVRILRLLVPPTFLAPPLPMEAAIPTTDSNDVFSISDQALSDRLHFVEEVGHHLSVHVKCPSPPRS